jgi:hypothetical protein
MVASVLVSVAGLEGAHSKQSVRKSRRQRTTRRDRLLLNPLSISYGNIFSANGDCSAPTGRLPLLTRGRGRLVVASAGRPPNFDEQFFDSIDEQTVELLIEALPALLGLLLFAFVAPLMGVTVPGAVGVVLGTLGLAYISGYLEKIQRELGVRLPQAVLIVAGCMFGILAIPAFLRFGFLLIAVVTAVNLGATLLGLSPTTFDSKTEGRNSDPSKDSVDASKAVIDVEFNTVDE